ncbi:MAG: SusC/RagA family TonB-linked outer membrane protein [Bacteroidales bacterium]|nr:SusC/RagA family TonB-linked outer membrane protein [Bacteroidales bacterium]
MKKAIFTLLFSLIFIVCSFAQEKTITGKVTSIEDEMGLPGVTVMVKGKTLGTVTDIEGLYSLSGVNPQDTLVFSFIGYEKQEIPVGSKNQINVVLKVEAEELEEVVVTALGVKRQKREIGYSTEKIDADVVVRSNAPNVINAIIGRSAGVQVSQNDGLEGGSTRITIRGNNNLSGNNQPLIVVDNVPMENTPGLTDIGRGVDWGNPLSDINPLDIADYSVLKGGAASALYGSRGANGVILITTKRGKKQKGIGVTYNFSHKIIQPYRFREMQNTYGHGGPISFTPPTFPMNGDTLLYPGIYGTDNLIINQEGDVSSTTAEFGYYGSAVSWGPKMEGQMVKWWDGEMRSYSPQPDNYESVFHNGYTQTHNLSASGGGEVGTMRVSITRQDHKAIIDNSDYDRTTINLGANLKISDKVRADLSMSYINFNRLNSPILGEEANSFNKGFLYSWPRSYQLIDKENYAYPDGSQNPQEGYPFYYISPTIWWNYYNNNTNLHRDKYVGALTLTYDITSWLNIMGRVGRDFTLEQYESKNKPIDVIGLMNGYYANSLNRTYSDIFEAFLTADKSKIFNTKLDVRFTLGASRWDHNLYMIDGHSGTWYYPNMYTFFNYTETTYSTDEYGNTIVDRPGNSAGDLVPGETISRERNNSVFSFLNLSWDNYLFLELTGRNDWSSTLPEGDNSYFYPSVSLSFVASEAFKIQEKVRWLNFVKLRGGIAQTATDTDPYRIDFYYRTGVFGGEQTSGFPSVIPPFNLTPQRVNAYEGGINLGFFENKIDFDFTYYYMYSFSQILENLPVPVSSGSPGITINEGVITNRGYEIIINTVPVQTNNFLFKTGINLSHNKNRVESLGDYAEIFPLADIWGLNGPAMALREGDEYGTIYGYDYVYHENGQPIVNDAGTKYLITDTRVPIGNASPDFIGGWTTEFYYKGFRLSTLIDTKWGGDIYCGSYVINLQAGLSPETLTEREGGGLPYTDPDGNVRNVGITLDGVYADGTPNDKVVHYYYKYLPNAGGWGKFLSTPGIVENTWVKMREISLTYTLPQKLIEKTKVFQNLTLSIVGRDLFYIYTTLPDKINPEGIMGSGNAQGFEWASMPGTRSITFGVTASF